MEHSLRFPLDSEKVAPICRRYHVRKLSVFGSALRDDFRPDSDVDLLVEFEAGHVPGFLTLAAMERELTPLLDNHPADIVTPRFLSPLIREEVLQTARPQYAKE